MAGRAFCYPFWRYARYFLFMAFQGDSIYWVEVEKIVPNPFQPRREFDQNKLQELADSIRMYGVLQPLTVTRKEIQRDDGTFFSEYELIAGERRLRASRLAGVSQVPVIIREGEQSEQEKLELAIIENLQREDLNAVDRALAFQQLAEMFGLSHVQVAQKMGRSREYVSNSIRLLGLPSHMLDALRLAKLSEGHARTLLMLNDRKEEQEVVFQEILLKKLSVREVERIARKIATDKIRKRNPDEFDIHLIEIEKQFTETLGTRVQIQKTDFGGKLTIDYFSTDDLEVLLQRIKNEYQAAQGMQSPVAQAAAIGEATPLMMFETEMPAAAEAYVPSLAVEEHPVEIESPLFIPEVADDIAEETLIEPEEDDSDLYSISKFTV
jgi:ParB family transcriptional regulator, chromosome partitioning protein